MLDKGFLQRIEFVALSQAFDGKNVFAFHPDGQLAAGIQVTTVDDDGAGAALAAITADLGAGETQLVAQDLSQGIAMLDFNTKELAVDLEVNYRSAAS